MWMDLNWKCKDFDEKMHVFFLDNMNWLSFSLDFTLLFFKICLVI